MEIDIKKQIMDICKSMFPYEIDYIYTHMERYYQSYEFIKGYIKPGYRILDIGGGNNGSTFTELIKRNFDCIIESHDKDLRYPFNISSDKYDLIICMEVIEHIKDRNSDNILDISQFNWDGMNNIMSEMNRCLKRDAYLFITTPNACSYDCIIKILCGKNPTHFLPHVKEFAYYELLDFVKRFEFDIDRSETLDSWNSEVNDIGRDSVIGIMKQLGLSTENRLQNTFCVAKKIV